MSGSSKPIRFIDLLAPKSLTAELIGTAILVFSICIVVTSADVGNTSITDIALVHFLILGGLIYNLGGISGAHFNPAVTIQFMAFRMINPITGLFYILTQLVGGVLGAGLAYAIMPGVWIQASNMGSEMATNKVNPAFEVFQGFIGEVLVTAMLAFAIWGVAVSKGDQNTFAGWSIAGVVATGVLLLGPITGNSLNPARSFGPSVIMGSFYSDHWVFWLGPIVGALIGGACYRFLFFKSETSSKSKVKSSNSLSEGNNREAKNIDVQKREQVVISE